MTSETTRYETYQKDSYNFSFGMIGGRANNCNSRPGHGKPSKPSRKRRKHYSVQGGTGHNNQNNDDDDNDDDGNNNNHHVQSQPPQQQGVSLQTAPPQQQGVSLQTAPGAYAYPYQCPPPPYPNQLAAVGGYHGDYNVVPGYPYPAGSFVPPQGGYGGGHIKDVGLVGAAIGVASFGMFKLLHERRRYGRG